MIGLKHNIFKEGAALAHGASTEIADMASETARRHFKQAFFETLGVYLCRANDETRDWLREALDIADRARREGRSVEETKEAIEQAAEARGLENLSALVP